MNLSLKEVLDGYSNPESQYSIYIPEFKAMVDEVTPTKDGYELKLYGLHCTTTLTLVLSRVTMTAGVPMLSRYGDSAETLIILKNTRLSSIT